MCVCVCVIVILHACTDCELIVNFVCTGCPHAANFFCVMRVSVCVRVCVCACVCVCVCVLIQPIRVFDCSRDEFFLCKHTVCLVFVVGLLFLFFRVRGMLAR